MKNMWYSYHHLYKSHFLNRKCNQQIDYALYALMQEMAIYYKDWHERQSVGLEGSDLLGRRRWEIMAHVEKITHNLIQDFGDSAHFYIASLSCSGEFHVVDLGQIRCDCEDYHQILFCRHIIAIYLHFPHLNPKNRKSTLMCAPERA